MSVVSRELAEKEQKHRELEEEEKRLREELEGSSEYKQLTDQESDLHHELLVLSREKDAIESSIIIKVTTDGRTPEFLRSSQYYVGKHTNIRDEVFAAIKTVGLRSSDLTNEQIENIARHIIAKEMESVAEKLGALKEAKAEVERKLEKIQDQVWRLERPADKARERIFELEGDIKKLKTQATHGGKQYQRKIETRNAYPEKLDQIYGQFKAMSGLSKNTPKEAD